MTAPMPEAPTDVRVVLPGAGAEILCDLLYDGQDPDGVHIWLAVPRVPVRLVPGIRLCAGILPGHTALRFLAATEEDR